MSDIKGKRRFALRNMKKIVRNGKRAAAEILLLALVLLCCIGCTQQKEDSLESLLPEEIGAEENLEKSTEADREEATEEIKEKAGEEKEDSKRIFVYVCGAVHMPGVYELEAGARIYQAVVLAGGVREDAAEEFVNQAQQLQDGERIYIPTEEEIRQGTAEVTTGNPGIGDTRAESTQGGGKVNLNTASEEELKTLSGIGDTRAKSIIAYREENGGFQAIEDLMKVEGIKEGVFEKIKDSITVNAGS